HVAEIQQRHTNKHTLMLDLTPEQILIATDPDKFEEMLHNLISNAIKYAPDGGEIRVITRLEPASDEYPCGSLLLQVTDKGPGFNMKDLQILRQASTKPTNRTLGGMLLVRKLVEAHHGVS